MLSQISFVVSFRYIFRYVWRCKDEVLFFFFFFFFDLFAVFIELPVEKQIELQFISSISSILELTVLFYYVHVNEIFSVLALQGGMEAFLSPQIKIFPPVYPSK